ncbi:MAG: L,D-transpeptidase family protein, partial [Leptospiraceae bacterium]|nr:L,D-transpeptidase family protein [Leptospiraceae bacterium]
LSFLLFLIRYPLISFFKRKFFKQQSLEDVRKKYSHKLIPIQKILSDKGISFPISKLYLLAFKKERILEVHTEKNGKKLFLFSYRFTTFSGKLGPKLVEGDRQIPEGKYKIDYLNPNSSYHLSMKVSYPNAFDAEKAKLDGRENPGSDIFIHGKDVSIGCIAIGDDKIEELFLIVDASLQAFGKDSVEILIFPGKLEEGKFPDCEICPSWHKELYDVLRKDLLPFL